MLSVGQLNEGVVLDHIQAGKSMDIYKYLKLDKMDCCVAIIKNARSNKMGRKDIIKVECPIEELDLDVLGWGNLSTSNTHSDRKNSYAPHPSYF